VPVTVTLPYGDATVSATLAATARWLLAPPTGPAPAIESLLAAALDAPIGSPRLGDCARAGDRVTVIVSDATRTEPRAALLAAVRDRLPEVRLTIAIATGTHGRAGGLAALDVPLALYRDAAVIDHDGHDPRDLVDVGLTSRGTPVRVHRAVVDTDLVVATGVIRPHYFAGFSAGAKAIFPGLAEAASARVNHRWKEDPGARPGAIAGNPCRADLDEAAALVGGRPFLLDGVADGHGLLRGAVAGSLARAFERGVELARPWVTVGARRARWIVVGDRGPVTASLYQASKLVAAVAPLLADDGTIVVVAPCPAGVGPVDVVNRGIYQIGLAPRLPPRHRVVLVSDLARPIVDQTYATWAPDLATALAGADDVLVVPEASKLVIDVLD